MAWPNAKVSGAGTQALTDFRACSVSLASMQAAIRAGVGTAPPKDSAEFALAALVAAGHVSQSKVDEARALMPEGGHAPEAAPD